MISNGNQGTIELDLQVPRGNQETRSHGNQGTIELNLFQVPIPRGNQGNGTGFISSTQ